MSTLASMTTMAPLALLGKSRQKPRFGPHSQSLRGSGSPAWVNIGVSIVVNVAPRQNVSCIMPGVAGVLVVKPGQKENRLWKVVCCKI